MKAERIECGDLRSRIKKAAELIRSSGYLIAFTGAGISVESGIPPFRGPDGLWSRYDPAMFELGYFLRNPERVWPILKKIFFDCFAASEPNEAHRVLARLEERGLLKAVITQNIDNLHPRAGSRKVVEYHGNSRRVVCTRCGGELEVGPEIFSRLPPRCECGGVLKPDFIFFGEDIPKEAYLQSQEAVARADAVLVVGSTGEVFPAASVPYDASARGAKIIEVNPEPSNFTSSITNLFISLPATEALGRIEKELQG